MKSLAALTMAIFVVAAFPYAHAAGQRSNQEKCVVKYLLCKDHCNNFQDQSQIGPCKQGCGKTYQCRPNPNHHNNADLTDYPVSPS